METALDRNKKYTTGIAMVKKNKLKVYSPTPKTIEIRILAWIVKAIQYAKTTDGTLKTRMFPSDKFKI